MRFRMGGKGWVRGRRAIAAGLIVVVAGLAGGCDGSPTEAEAQDQSTTTASDADLSIVLGDLSEGLGLTDDQSEAVRALLEEYRGQGRSGNLWYAAADLQDILSSEQIEALQARRAELGDGTRARRGGMGRGSGEDSRRRGGFRTPRSDSETGWGRILDGLDLSEEQIAELKQIRESLAPQFEEIRDGVRSGSITRDEAEDRLSELREAMHEAMVGILTDDQLLVLEEHRVEAEARREERRNQWEEREQTEQAAMVGALVLTADQVAAIEALRESFREEGRPSAEEGEARREEHHQALFDILDDEQEEIWILHGALSQSFARHQIRGRAGDGAGTGRRRGTGGPGGFRGAPDPT